MFTSKLECLNGLTINTQFCAENFQNTRTSFVKLLVDCHSSFIVLCSSFASKIGHNNRPKFTIGRLETQNNGSLYDFIYLFGISKISKCYEIKNIIITQVYRVSRESTSTQIKAHSQTVHIFVKNIIIRRKRTFVSMNLKLLILVFCRYIHFLTFSFGSRVLSGS